MQQVIAVENFEQQGVLLGPFSWPQFYHSQIDFLKFAQVTAG
jgi:hypothetical protein